MTVIGRCEDNYRVMRIVSKFCGIIGICGLCHLSESITVTRKMCMLIISYVSGKCDNKSLRNVNLSFPQQAFTRENTTKDEDSRKSKGFVSTMDFFGEFLESSYFVDFQVKACWYMGHLNIQEYP